MTPVLRLMTAAALVGLPQIALAGPDWTIGGALTTSFDTSSGLTHSSTTGEAFIDASQNGFHGGLWVGTLYQDPTDDLEIELSFGYGGEAGALGYDLSVIGYYLNNSGYDHVGVAGELSYALSDTVTGILATEVNVDTGQWDSELAMEFALSDSVTTWGLIGTSQADANNYGELGVSYALNDFTAIEMVYADANDGAGELSLSLAFETSLTGN